MSARISRVPPLISELLHTKGDKKENSSFEGRVSAVRLNWNRQRTPVATRYFAFCQVPIKQYTHSVCEATDINDQRRRCKMLWTRFRAARGLFHKYVKSVDGKKFHAKLLGIKYWISLLIFFPPFFFVCKINKMGEWGGGWLVQDRRIHTREREFYIQSSLESGIQFSIFYPPPPPYQRSSQIIIAREV